MEELINKTQLSLKIISTSSRRLDDSTKESHFTYSIIVHLLQERRFPLIINTNHTVQKLQG